MGEWDAEHCAAAAAVIAVRGDKYQRNTPRAINQIS